MRRRYSHLILLCVALLYLAMSLYLINVRGPNYIFKRKDHAYIVIFNSLNVINSEPFRVMNQPATTYLVFGVAVIKTVYLIYGTADDIETDILQNPELYQRAYIHSLMVILTLVIFISGILVYSATKNLFYGILFQVSPLLLDINQHIFAIGGGMSENFQLACGLLLAAIALKLVKYAPSSEPSTISNKWTYTSMDIPWGRYAILFAMVIGFCIASKFTALPLLVFPLVLIPGIRRKLFFVLAATVSSLLFMLPILRYWKLIITRMINKWALGSREHLASGGDDSPIDRVLDGCEKLNAGAPGFFIILMLCICFCVLMLVLKRYTRIHFNPIASRLMFATTICLVCATWFLVHRPHTHYLFPFVGLSGLGMILVFSITADMVRFSRWELERGWWVVSRGLPVFVLVLFALVRSSGFQGNVERWRKMKDDVMSLNRILEDKYKDVAKINVPYISNIWWALVHSNNMAKQVHRKKLASIVPPDQYFYRWDDGTFYKAGGQHFSIEEIASRHNRVVFIGRPFEYMARNPIYPTPEGLTKHPAYQRGSERITQVDEISPYGRFSFGPSGKTEQSRKSTTDWESSGGFPQWLKVDFFPNISRPVITRYEFRVRDKGAVGKMLKSWQLQGSNDGINWSVLDVRMDESNWKYNLFYAVPQSLGTVDLYDANVAVIPGVFTAESLKEILELVKEQPRLKTPRNVRFVNSADPCNVFKFKNLFYAIPNSLGPLDWNKSNIAALPGVITAKTSRRMLDIIFERQPLPENHTKSPLTYVQFAGTYNIIKSKAKNSYDVSSPGAYRYYRLYVTSGMDPASLKVDGVSLYTKTEDLYGKSRVVHPNIIRSYDYDHPNKGDEICFTPLPFFERVSGTFPIWLEMDLGESKSAVAALYNLKSGPNTPERMPRDWHFQGSNDTTTWFTLDTRENQTAWRNNEIREFVIEEPGQFRYYRLLITASNSSRIVRLYGWKLFEGMGAEETESIFSPLTGSSQEEREPYEMHYTFVTEPPQFVQSMGTYNIIKFYDLFYAVPQGLGEVDFNKEDVAAMPEVLTSNRLEDILKSVKAQLR